MISPLTVTVLCYPRVTFRPPTYDRMLFEYSEGFESFDWCTGSQIPSFSFESTLHHAGQMEQSKDPKVKSTDVRDLRRPEERMIYEWR
jgi:hypothetical protein